MKLFRKLMFVRLMLVTPFVGVWIETASGTASITGTTVTPFVGVWIETECGHPAHKDHHVTPFVGVWIET